MTSSALEKTLTSRVAKLPQSSMLDYASSPGLPLSTNDDTFYKFMGMTSKSPWGACAHQFHACSPVTTSSDTSSTGKKRYVTLGPIDSPSAHFVSDAALLLPSNAKVTRWSMKMGTQEVQTIDSWFAADVLLKFKRQYKESKSEKEGMQVIPAPFFYTEDLLKAFPLFMPNSIPPYYEFDIEGLSDEDAVKGITLMNEYCSSELESSAQDLDLFMQYIPSMITSVTTVHSTKSSIEIPLNSNGKVVKSLYFRVYNDQMSDMEVVNSVELKPNGGKIPVIFCRNYFKNKYDTSPLLPYYVIPFCPKPKTNMQEYGEVFNLENDKLVLQLDDNVEVGEGEQLKIDVALEFVNRIVWSTKATL